MSARELASFDCPECGHSRMARRNGADKLYDCERCGHSTHEAVEAARDELEALAESDGPASGWAETLLRGGSE